MAERIPLSSRDRFEILKRDKFTCRYCGRKSPEVKLHVDHVTPVAEGGNNHPSNLCAACADCNLGKGAGSFETSELFREWIGIEMGSDWREHVQRQLQALKDYLLRKFPEADGTKIESFCRAWLKRCDPDLTEFIAIALDQPSWADWVFTCGASFGRQLETSGLRDELIEANLKRTDRMRAYVHERAVSLGFREADPPEPQSAPEASARTSTEVN